MIERPERQIEAFAKAGADSITIHAEATPHLHYTLQAIKAAGCLSGLALNPGTPAEAVSELEPDMVLCMTVNPGWGGQTFLEHSLSKLVRIRDAGRPGHRRSRSTAGSTPRRPRSAPRRAPRCSSPGPPCSARRTPPQAVQTISTAITGRKPRNRVVRPAVCERVPPGDENRTRGLHRPHRRRPPVLSGERSRAARERGLQRHRRGGGRGQRGRRRPVASSPNSCCWTCSSPTSTASTSRPASPGKPDSPAVILVSSRDSSDFGPLVSRSGARGFVPEGRALG